MGSIFVLLVVAESSMNGSPRVLDAPRACQQPPQCAAILIVAVELLFTCSCSMPFVLRIISLRTIVPW